LLPQTSTLLLLLFFLIVLGVVHVTSFAFERFLDLEIGYHLQSKVYPDSAVITLISADSDGADCKVKTVDLSCYFRTCERLQDYWYHLIYQTNFHLSS